MPFRSTCDLSSLPSLFGFDPSLFPDRADNDDCMVEVRVDVGELFNAAVVIDEGVSDSVLSVEEPLWISSWNECRILSVRASISSFKPSPSISTMISMCVYICT